MTVAHERWSLCNPLAMVAMKHATLCYAPYSENRYTKNY